MPEAGVRRGVLTLRHTGGREWARVDILHAGLVRLQLITPDGTQEVLCETLDELPFLAAMTPLPAALYEQLLWELDLMGLRGEA